MARPRSVVLNPSLVLDVGYELRRRVPAAMRGRHKGKLEERALVQAIWRAGIAALEPAALEVLLERGILIDENDRPATVRLSCTLGLRPDASVRLWPGRLPEIESMAQLVPNPDIIVQTDRDAPAALGEFAADTRHLGGERPILWVADPGTELRFPYQLERASRERVLAVLAGRASVARLPPALRIALRRALVLLPKGYAERRKILWRARCAAAAAQIASEGYAVLRDIVNPFALAALRHYYRGLEREGYLSYGDAQVTTRRVLHNERASRCLHLQLVPLLNRIVPAPIKASYAYLAVYEPGSVLARHKDREQCEWNLSIPFDSDPETDRRSAWPIHLVATDGRPRAIRLGMGDGVLYRGTEVEHWRDAQPAGRRSTVCFFHFVRAQFDRGLD